MEDGYREIRLSRDASGTLVLHMRAVHKGSKKAVKRSFSKPDDARDIYRDLEAEVTGEALPTVDAEELPF